MARTADYTIQGFIYQFLITLSKLLENSDDAEIIIEGVIEDIDIVTPLGTEVFQCKYHETKTNFTLSAIYKPVLQMLCHFKSNKADLIKYRLHAHFPNELVNSVKKITAIEIQEILKTKTKELKKYVDELAGFEDFDSFIKKFEIHFGASYSDTERSVIVALSKEGLTTEDVQEIFYPNAIHRIAEFSIEHDVKNRKTTKKVFLRELKLKKKSAISRWTKELQSYSQILKKRKSQLRENLNKNSRFRAIIIDGDYIKNFENDVAMFLEDYIEKYNSKIKLNVAPLVSLISTEEQLNKIWEKLHNKGIEVERGMRAGKMDIDYFLRNPMKSIKDNKAEFHVRICNHDKDFQEVIQKAKIDDIILLTDKEIENKLLTLKNVNVEIIATSEIKEIRYLLSLNDTV